MRPNATPSSVPAHTRFAKICRHFAGVATRRRNCCEARVRCNAERRSVPVVLARVVTFAIDGIDPRPVWVEVDVRPGLPAFRIVGLADAAVREARERVHAAILNSGFDFPARRITANLAPAHLRKVGPGFDAALAVGLLGGERTVLGGGARALGASSASCR